MNYYDDQLQQLLAQCARKRTLESQIKELQAQRDQYASQARELEQSFHKEQADVDRLEGRSLAAFFYQVLGKQGEKLSKEREEAYAARVKYDAAARELAEVEEDLRRCRAELATLGNCESRYTSLLEEKIQAVKKAGGPEGERILKLEEQISALESQERELEEAASAGRKALSIAEQVLSSLGSAETWGTWDLVSRGVLADLAKHERLDAAQESVERLQSQLRTFKTELADVTLDHDLQVSVEGFLRFADYFFDGILVDWTVLDHIHQSQRQVQEVKSQISTVLQRLQVRSNQERRKQSELEQEIRRLASSVAM